MVGREVGRGFGPGAGQNVARDRARDMSAVGVISAGYLITRLGQMHHTVSS